MEEEVPRRYRRSQTRANSGAQAKSAGDGDFSQFFRLQEGEKIIESIKPLPGLKWMFFLQGMLGWIFFILFFGVWLLSPVGIMLAIVGGALAAILGLVIFILFLLAVAIIPYILASMRYGKRYYWVTSKRVIGKSGFIGYKVNSIPLERISDVIISRSFAESIFGFGSVHVQTMAGQVAMRGRFGAEGNFQAVPDPEGLQQQIFDLVKKKRKAEGITM